MIPLTFFDLDGTLLDSNRAWEDIDRKSGTITINKKVSYATNQPVLEDHTKTAAGMRTVPLLAPLADALPRDRIGLIFHREDGGYLNSRDIETLWRAFCDGAGLYTTQQVKGDSGARQVARREYPYTLHWMRHTFATICYNAGVDVKAAASILGLRLEHWSMEIFWLLSTQRQEFIGEGMEAYLIL